VTFTIRKHTGPRTALRPLFALAEDSEHALDAYIDSGRVLIAVEGGEPVGHLQLTDTDDPATAELRNMAVLESHQRRGVGSALVAAAVDLVRDEGRSRLVVATAAADIGNLRFYQRLGFRMLAIERDAFTPQTGYPENVDIDGIPLRDRVWLDRTVG
jgi:GNAT superfamily N-acetyltransferase